MVDENFKHPFLVTWIVSMVFAFFGVHLDSFFYFSFIVRIPPSLHFVQTKKKQRKKRKIVMMRKKLMIFFSRASCDWNIWQSKKALGSKTRKQYLKLIVHCLYNQTLLNQLKIKRTAFKYLFELIKRIL